MVLDKTVAIRFEESLTKELEDFRFEHRFLSRSETVRWLLQWALRQKAEAAEDASRTLSQGAQS
jgi:metal-responsive CopG/Arc/MetJ family transcriptional regulator